MPCYCSEVRRYIYAKGVARISGTEVSGVSIDFVLFLCVEVFIIKTDSFEPGTPHKCTRGLNLCLIVNKQVLLLSLSSSNLS